MENTDGSDNIKQLQLEIRLLKEQNRLLSAIMDNAPILISAKDLNGNILIANQQFSVLDGPEPEAYLNRNVFDLFPKQIAEQLWENDKKAQTTEIPIQAEEHVFHKDGSIHTYHTTKFRLLDDDDKLIGTCAVSFDISNMKMLEKEVQHDYLTGLYNRRLLEKSVENELARTAREKHFFVFALIDLDHFKGVNDKYGHLTGDRVLVAAAEAFKQVLHRPGDFCYRLGGDEFVVTFSAPCQEIAETLLTALRGSINSAVSELITSSHETCEASIGACLVSPGDSLPFHQLYAQADQALYRSKKSETDKISWFEYPFGKN